LYIGVQLQQQVYAKLFCSKIPKAQQNSLPKAQNNSQVVGVFLRFWDLCKKAACKTLIKLTQVFGQNSLF